MNTKDTVYISGVEVNFKTLPDGLPPDFWWSANPPASSQVKRVLGRLISRIKADLAARDGGPAFTPEEILTRFTRKGERAQAEMLAGMVGGLVRLIQRPRKLYRRLKEYRLSA